MAGHPDGNGEATAVDQLCDDVVHQYHEVLRHELPALARLLATLPDGAAIAELRRSLVALSAVLEPHLAKEENIVFPALKQLAEAARAAQVRPALPFPSVIHPIRMMEAEHRRLEAVQERLRALCHGLEPGDASPGVRDACAAVIALDARLSALLRFEDHVLFPRALDLERGFL